MDDGHAFSGYMCGINNIFLFENLSLDGVPTRARSRLPRTHPVPEADYPVPTRARSRLPRTHPVPEADYPVPTRARSRLPRTHPVPKFPFRAPIPHGFLHNRLESCDRCDSGDICQKLFQEISTLHCFDRF